MLEQELIAGENDKEVISFIGDNVERSVHTELHTEQVNTNQSIVLKRIKRVEIINYLILIFLGAILTLNLFSLKPPTSMSTSTSEKPLPKSIGKTEANKIVNTIKEHYNNGDSHKLYDVFGDYTKTLLSFEEFDKQLNKINVLGKLNKATFTNGEFIKNSDGADWFKLNYVAKFESGDGKVDITVKVSKDEYEVTGFNFNVKNINE